MPDNLLDTGDAGSLSDVFTSPTCAFKPISWFHGFSFLLSYKPCRFQTVRICFKGSWHFHAFPPSCGPFLIISTTYERPPWTPSPRDTNEARLRRRARNFTSAQVMITISYLDLSQRAKWFLPLGFNWHPLESAGILVTSALPVVFSGVFVALIAGFYVFGLLASSILILNDLGMTSSYLIPTWKPTSSMWPWDCTTNSCVWKSFHQPESLNGKFPLMTKLLSCFVWIRWCPVPRCQLCELFWPYQS